MTVISARDRLVAASTAPERTWSTKEGLPTNRIGVIVDATDLKLILDAYSQLEDENVGPKEKEVEELAKQLLIAIVGNPDVMVGVDNQGLTDAAKDLAIRFYTKVLP